MVLLHLSVILSMLVQGYLNWPTAGSNVWMGGSIKPSKLLNAYYWFLFLSETMIVSAAGWLMDHVPRSTALDNIPYPNGKQSNREKDTWHMRIQSKWRCGHQAQRLDGTRTVHSEEVARKKRDSSIVCTLKGLPMWQRASRVFLIDLKSLENITDNYKLVNANKIYNY